MTWWDAVRAWFDGKRQTAFPKPTDAAPEQKTVYTGRADWISKRVNLPTSMSSGELAAEWDAKIRAQAFFSARVAQGHVLDKLREVSDAFSRGEIGQAEARTMLKRFLRAEGLDDGSAGLRNLASTARLNLILEQNARMAAAVGQYQEGMDPDVKDFFPCWRYIGSTAMNPRDSHAKYAGHVYRKDDPIWHKIFPPSDFGCKCSVENCDEPPEKSPARVELPDSGFHFDPAHAFEDFDLSAINDAKLREETRRGLEEINASVMEPRAEVISNPRSPRASTLGIFVQEDGDLPQTDEFRKIRPVYKALKEGEDKFAETIATKGAVAKREFVGIYDADGKPYWFGAGPRKLGMAQFPADLPAGCTFIHNHPGGSTFSVQDILAFNDSNMSKMVAVVCVKDEQGQEIVKKYSLTKRNTGAKLKRNDIEKRFDESKSKGLDDYAAWKEALNGTDYEISFD